MEFLILAQPDDETALRVAAALRRRHGREAVGIVSAEALAMAPKVVHTLSSNPGQSNLAIESAITLASGAQLLSGELRAVFNRLRASDVPHFHAASASDRDYASAEMGALWVSWLAGLQSLGAAVINPVGRGAVQVGFSRLEWLKLAAQAGLPVNEIQVNSAGAPAEVPPQAMGRWLAAGRRLLVLDSPAAPALDGQQSWRTFNEASASHFPAVSAGLHDKIQSLQAACACALLELIITFTTDQGSGAIEDYSISAINPFPYLVAPETTLALALMLEEAAR